MDVSTGNIYYFLNDRLGTPQLMTDDTGTVVWEASYQPFGEATVNPKSNVVNNFRFPGQYYDQETGLHYNYHRYYDPRIGRYLRADPSHTIQPEGVGIPYLFPFVLYSPQELNCYTYVVNNPIMSSDPFGLARYFVFWQMKSVSAVVIPAGATKIKGTIVSIKRNQYGTYDAIDFEGTFIGAALGPLPLAGTVNNQEYFEDPCEQPDLTRIEGWSRYLAGSMALYELGVSGGGYQFGAMRGVKETPSWAKGFDLGVDFMIGKTRIKGEVYQVTGDIFPAVGY